MTQIVARSIVPDLGGLACAYFHTSAHPSDNPGGKSVDPRDVTDPHFIAVRRNEIAQSPCSAIRMVNRLQSDSAQAVGFAGRSCQI